MQSQQQSEPATAADKDQVQQAPREPPLVVWSRILEYVDVRHRCSSCALVSRSWAAAVSGTRHVRLKSCLAHSAHFNQFKSWLVQHGKHTTSLEIHVNEADGTCLLNSLPLPRLKELLLHGYRPSTDSKAEGLVVQLVLSTTTPGVLAAAAGLTRLALHNVCHRDSWAADLAAVGALTYLKHLELSACDDTLPASLLSDRLSQLTHLSLQDSVSSSTLQHLSCLQKLKQLKLGLLIPMIGAASAGSLAGLPQLQHLTSLSLFGCWFPISTISTPWVCKLTQLRTLHLHTISYIQPAALCDLTQLQSLYLKASHLAETDTAGMCWPFQQSCTAPGIAALLQWLLRQPHLTQLSLPAVLDIAVLPAAAYAGLTASSSLRRLDLTKARIPSDAWQYMFAPGTYLPHLTTLMLQGSTGPSGPASAPNLASLVSSCPALQQLHVDCHSQQAGQQLQPLGQLTALSSLTLHSFGLAAARAAAALTQLRELRVFVASTLAHAELEPLTALVQLQVLVVMTWSQLMNTSSTKDAADSTTTTDPRSICLTLTNKAPCSSPPDVWQQLQQHCAQREQQASRSERLSAQFGMKLCLSDDEW